MMATAMPQALSDLIAQREADDNETASDGGEL